MAALKRLNKMTDNHHLFQLKNESVWGKKQSKSGDLRERREKGEKMLASFCLSSKLAPLCLFSERHSLLTCGREEVG